MDGSTQWLPVQEFGVTNDINQVCVPRQGWNTIFGYRVGWGGCGNLGILEPPNITCRLGSFYRTLMGYPMPPCL